VDKLNSYSKLVHLGLCYIFCVSLQDKVQAAAPEHSPTSWSSSASRTRGKRLPPPYGITLGIVRPVERHKPSSPVRRRCTPVLQVVNGVTHVLSAPDGNTPLPPLSYAYGSVCLVVWLCTEQQAKLL